MQTHRETVLIGLFAIAFDSIQEEVYERVHAAGYSDLRPTHGCVFGTITPEGARLTDLAERAEMTKQAVGEVVSELEKMGYVERAPDPADGRAKIIRLTERGVAAWTLGHEVFDEIRGRWAERYGAERVSDMIDLLQEMAVDLRPARLGLRPAA